MHVFMLGSCQRVVIDTLQSSKMDVSIYTHTSMHTLLICIYFRLRIINFFHFSHCFEFIVGLTCISLFLITTLASFSCLLVVLFDGLFTSLSWFLTVVFFFID